MSWIIILNLISVLDPESHIMFFDIEALIVELLREEYSSMSPSSLEAAGLISASEYNKVAALTQSASPDVHKKVAGNFYFFYRLFILSKNLNTYCVSTSIQPLPRLFNF